MFVSSGEVLDLILESLPQSPASDDSGAEREEHECRQRASLETTSHVPPSILHRIAVRISRAEGRGAPCAAAANTQERRDPPHRSTHTAAIWWVGSTGPDDCEVLTYYGNVRQMPGEGQPCRW